MNAKVFERLTELLREGCYNPGSFGRPDVDELSYLANLEINSLPEKFLALVRWMDQNLPNDPIQKKTVLERLSRILTVSIEFDSRSPVEYDGDALVPTFQLSQDDKARVVVLCQEMRKIIFASQVFDEPHRRRLLNRVAAIEAQLLQEKGIFDIVRGGLNDLGETLGKFGADIKPLTDRMSEVVKIVRGGTKEYDQLPPPDEVKRLPPPEV